MSLNYRRNILIADDHAIVRYGLSLLINENIPTATLHEASTFDQAKEILNEQRIDLLILDINMPGGDSIKMIENIRVKWPATRILMFSSYLEDLYAIRYIQAGAQGYVHKETNEKDILKAIEQVLCGKTFMSEHVKEIVINNAIGGENPTGISSLSNRELDVAKLLIKGSGTVEIANILNLQMSTISTYKKRIFEKLRIKNVVELVELFQKGNVKL
ncbi:response regulator transcription factor [Desertivirga brevis]|uniref:response regulator transcription factor n=1 Tax=Desertivirga brevis TaxID=2810310 RepID=UPI001A97072E|nr:response regulator transcription factor [Pedobacter sp. SYSU D00873]